MAAAAIDPALEALISVPPEERTEKLVYVGVAGDIIHHGHVNILNHAKKLGRVVCGLLTCDAIESYKRRPIIPWDRREIVMRSFVGVDKVIPQHTLSYVSNLELLRPNYVVHGNDWCTGTQQKTRDDVIWTLAKWGGELIEPQYTPNISTTYLINRFSDIETEKGTEPKEGDDTSNTPVKTRRSRANSLSMEEVPKRETPLVYMAVSSDFLHHGHINILNKAREYGQVTVGLLTDEACGEYRSIPVLPLESRQMLFSHLVGVEKVVLQNSLDYTKVLQELKPDFVLHGDNWKVGLQAVIREAVIETLADWGGTLVELKYSTELHGIAKAIQLRCHETVMEKKAKDEAASFRK